MRASMKQPRPTAARLGLMAGASAVLVLVGAVDTAHAGRTAVGLTADNRLVGFDTDNPSALTGTVSVSGLDDGEQLLGIDFRPAQPSQLFSVSSFGQIYQINASSGSATKVGTAIAPGDLPLQGSSFGFDFNPTVDRVRLVDDLGANARLNQTNGTVVDADPATPGTQRDGNLAYAAGDINAGQPAGVNSVAYSNNDNDPATGTTLYGIDSAFGVLVTIEPPNAGTLNTVGSLGQDDLPDLTGFDIFGEDEAFAVSKAEPAFGSLPALKSRLFAIDLATGGADELGVIGDGSLDLAGFALTGGDGVGGGGGGEPNPIPIPPAVLAAPVAFAIGAYAHRRARRRFGSAGA